MSGERHARAPGTGAASCPVAALAAEVRDLHAADDRNDEATSRLRTGPELSRLYRIEESIAARVQALELMAAERRAASVEGALFQLGVALSEVDVLRINASGAMRREAETIYWRVHALLGSVADVIGDLGGVRREDVLGERYLDRRHGPAALVDEALASREAARAQA